MPLTAIQQNILSEIQQLAQGLVDDKAQMTKLIGMWGNEFPQLPASEDLQALPEFAHISPQELSDAAVALLAINTTLGEFNAPAANVVKLLKIVLR